MDRLCAPPIQRFRARNWNLPSSGCPLIASTGPCRGIRNGVSGSSAMAGTAAPPSCPAGGLCSSRCHYTGVVTATVLFAMYGSAVALATLAMFVTEALRRAMIMITISAAAVALAGLRQRGPVGVPRFDLRQGTLRRTNASPIPPGRDVFRRGSTIYGGPFVAELDH